MFLVLTPLKKELDHLLASLEATGLSFEKKQDQGRWYWQSKALQATFCIGGHGKAQFAAQTQFWINKFPTIEHVIGVGAAGGLSKNTTPLDVVVANKIIEHDYLEKFNATATPPTFNTDAVLLQKLISFKPEGFLLHQGSIASGDEDIVGEERANELLKQTQSLAVAWESAGGARAAQFNNKAYSEIRGITDNARDNVVSHFLENLPQAMTNCSQVLLHILQV